MQKALRTGLILPMLLFAKMLHTAMSCDEVMTFESLQSTPFCLEKFSVFNVLTAFSVRIWLD